MREGENSIKLYQERFPLDLQREGASSIGLPPCLWTEQPLNLQALVVTYRTVVTNHRK